MRRTSANLTLNICSRFQLGDIRTKLNDRLKLSNIEYPLDILSESSVLDEDEFLFYNVKSVSLLLSAKSSTDIKLYTIIERFPNNKHSEEILSFNSLDKFIYDSSDVKEFGTLIGDIVYNCIA
ncbi:hypothetical protein [uncultured Prevotella sp.]|jgi:hypothetical protein|uniref:hypothetical protein n=1 Tax=uncultured Prevotella sp. TaxID=159272 RepID=UPI00258558AF|nr:hypothetical protein [uncultured Prevotella sp.]